MKLVYCTVCGDVFSLRYDYKKCTCGASGGNYLDDGLTASTKGPVIVLGFDNFSFKRARQLRPKSGKGKRFTAFVIPQECDTVIASE